MELTFYGAAGEVTGSCHLLRHGDRTVLLDCGLIQGGRRDEARNRDPFPFDPARIDAVVLSHAHLDHCGRLPVLVRRGFRGPIFAQEAGCELAAILLADAANLAERDAARQSRKTGKQVKPLFTLADGERTVRQFHGVRYRTWLEVVPGLEVRFHDAGHILGSCVVELRGADGGNQRTLVFSGDLGQYDTPILKDPESPGAPDLVLMESTYGGRRHRERQDSLRELGEVVAAAERGNVLIPAFAIGRSQEILYQFGKHFAAWGLDRFRIFLDSPMAIEASKVYWHYPHLYDAEATRLREDNGGMPLLPNLDLCRSAEESMAINRIDHGAIIIAGSGMCTGGRILHHLRHRLDDERNHVIIAGYQARGSLGRRLVDGDGTVRIHGRDIPVRAQVHTIGGFSAHGDQDDLARWYEGFDNRPPVWLVHGEDDARDAFAGYLSGRSSAAVHCPRPGESVVV